VITHPAIDRADADAGANADEVFMHRALILAERGRGRTSPNPMVGALIVSPDGIVVGRGFHERAGTPHAEVHAIADAGERARGATLYCTLEPCCHTGRTGPCTLAVERAGIARVVAAITDPNPAVAGGGLRYLRDRGIDVTVGVLGDRAARLNDVFFTNVTKRRPFVTLKIAMSLDARIAAAPGARTALTSAPANRHAQRLRAEVDAIAVGSETMLADDPLLTARDVYRWRPLARVIFDNRLRTPPTARMFATRDEGPILIVTSKNAVQAKSCGLTSRLRALEDAGATIVATEARDLTGAMTRLFEEHGICSVLLEGGAALHAAAWNAGLVDRVRTYVTPHALGPAGVPWEMPSSFDWTMLHDARSEWFGEDCLLEGYVHPLPSRVSDAARGRAPRESRES
jgi:diaminohydroxyphosphoribosylaminopyrimidine deaminase/5-amino-6-(5-phosphoribosylamino)uracil reductase